MEGFNSRVHIDEEKIIEQEGRLEETIQKKKKCQSHKRVKKLRVVKRQRRQKEDATYMYLKFRKRGKNE